MEYETELLIVKISMDLIARAVFQVQIHLQKRKTAIGKLSYNRNSTFHREPPVKCTPLATSHFSLRQADNCDDTPWVVQRR